MGCGFKLDEKREKAWDSWSDDVLQNGSLRCYWVLEEHGAYDWCFEFENGVQRFCRNAPEHIQRKLGVAEKDIIPDLSLKGNAYFHKKAAAKLGEES